jgi:hypothetical protein
MHPSSICSYYPTYSILDEVVSKNNYDSLNIYIDLKNVLQSLYMKHTIVNLIENTKLIGRTDTSIFVSVMAYLAFHRIYAMKRNLNIKFFLFFESGESYYHTNISKRYKISRRIDDLYGLDAIDRDLFFDLVRKNLFQINNVFNRVPNTKVIRLLNFEADFVPYFLLTRNLVDRSSNVGHITYSNDHDLCQNLAPHSYIFSKTQSGKKLVCEGSGMYSQLKTRINYSDDLQPLAIAIIGDPGDDVIGINGVGPKRFINLLPDLIKMIGDMDNLYTNVINDEPIFDSTGIAKNKYISRILKAEEQNKQISKNLKLVSFELISRHFEDPDTTEMLKRQKEFMRVLKEDNIVPFERMNNVLESHNVDFLDEDLKMLYQGFNGG